MSCSLCPHLVQDYFERVSDILTTYRPQILKQVEYDKISENLVLRGAVRPEEHQRIFQCSNLEGQVSQMLVVIQNRMWGLENLIAVFMEEHISPWLTQEMFRAYNEHLVSPLKHQRDNRICQCVRISNSVLYKGWVQALKSLDTWILKTGTVLGFVNQTIYPTTDNMLAFLSGDSQSSNRTDLVPFGFAPNSSGEVQVAELEEDDINDLISLSETLCIGYPSSKENDDGEGYDMSSKRRGDDNPSPLHVPETISNEAAILSSKNTRPLPVFAKPAERKATRRQTSEARSSGRRSSLETAQPLDTTKEKQRDLIARLSTPKSTKSSEGPTSLPAKPTPVRLRSIQTDRKGSALAPKPRPKSMEFHRSFSLSSTKSGVPSAESSSASSTSGKTTGFVRSKISVPTSPKAKQSPTCKGKPTAIATPTINAGQGKLKQMSKATTGKVLKPVAEPDKSEVDHSSGSILDGNKKEDEYEICKVEDMQFGEDYFPEFSTSPFYTKTILSNEYYQLNFDD